MGFGGSDNDDDDSQLEAEQQKELNQQNQELEAQKKQLAQRQLGLIRRLQSGGPSLSNNNSSPSSLNSTLG